MLSLFGLGGQSVLSGEESDRDDDEFVLGFGSWDAEQGNGDFLSDEDDTPTSAATESETIDCNRGEVITGFVPGTDILELEYSPALGEPEITIADWEGGNGSMVAINGVVVAEIEGVQGLGAEDVRLVPS